jgi:hypothetical protein
MEVRLSYRTEARDLFRASIGVAKFRILVGLGLTSILIGGLVMFFVAIDEKRILLQTSPLFIGLPLVALGGQLLRLHAMCRRYVSGLSSLERRKWFRFSDLADGIETGFGESRAHIAWNDIRKIAEKRHGFLVFMNKYDIQLIPKAAVEDGDQLRTLRTIFTAKLGSRAQLLS